MAVPAAANYKGSGAIVKVGVWDHSVDLTWEQVSDALKLVHHYDFCDWQISAWKEVRNAG